MQFPNWFQEYSNLLSNIKYTVISIILSKHVLQARYFCHVKTFIKHHQGGTITHPHKHTGRVSMGGGGGAGMPVFRLAIYFQAICLILCVCTNWTILDSFQAHSCFVSYWQSWGGGGWGGGGWSLLLEYFFPLLAWKSSGFAQILPDFFARKWQFENF